MMDERGQSDRLIVPGKPPNTAEGPAVEAGEGRGRAKGNSGEHDALRTPGRAGALSALDRVRQAAERDRKQRFTALLHHVYDVDHLRTAYHALKRDAAAGVDDETWKHYGEDLEGNLHDLAGRLRRGAYRAKPVRRAFIPKADGRLRPLGVPTVTAYCGPVQRVFGFPVCDAPVPPAGGPAGGDPLRASSSGHSHLCL